MQWGLKTVRKHDILKLKTHKLSKTLGKQNISQNRQCLNLHSPISDAPEASNRKVFRDSTWTAMDKQSIRHWPWESFSCCFGSTVCEEEEEEVGLLLASLGC